MSIMTMDEWCTHELVRTGKCIATRWMEQTNGDVPLEMFQEELYHEYVEDQLMSFMDKYVREEP